MKDPKKNLKQMVTKNKNNYIFHLYLEAKI